MNWPLTVDITRDRKVYLNVRLFAWHWRLRIHHGLACGVIGVAGVWHDRRDFPWKITDAN